MRASVALVVVAASTAARADTPRDPRDAFGFNRREVSATPLDCSDGRAFGCAGASDPLVADSPYALSTWLPADYLLSLPTADFTHDRVAHYALGASRDDAGPAFGGATGLENRWTIEGAPSDDPRLGGNDTRVPLVFLEGILVTAGGFAARDRASTGGTIDAQLLRGGDHHQVETRAFASWTAAPRDFPALAATYSPRTIGAAPGPSVSASIVATGPANFLAHGGGWRSWYAVGVAPSLRFTDFTWQASRLVDRDGNGIADGFPGVLALDPIETTRQSVPTYFVPAMARVGMENATHHIELTLIGHAETGTFFLGNSTLQAAGVNSLDFVGDAIATYRATWHDTNLKVQLAWHRSTHHEWARDAAAANIPQQLTAYVPQKLAEDPLLAAACDDSSPTDPSPKIAQCPVPGGFFASGGAGALVDRTADRPSLTAELAHRFGAHVARIGGTVEESRVVTTTRFTAGELDRSLFPGEVGQLVFVDPNVACSNDINQPCTTIPSSTLSWPTLYSAAYVEDTLTLAPGLVVDGGVRWELMWVGTVMHFSDELAPRFGVSWEREIAALKSAGGGRLRAFAGYGRTFTMLPAGLGATILRGAQTADTVTSPFGVGRVVDTGAAFAVARGVEPMAQDEVVAGVDLAAARAVHVRAWLQGRALARGLDATARGLDNPGRVAGEPVAARDTGMFAIELQTAPTLHLALRVGYTYGFANGTAAFAFDPRRGAVLYTGDDYTASLANLYGALPSDSAHRLYVEAQRRGTIAKLPVSASTRLTLASGRPRDVLGASDSGLVELLPRGSGGRGQMISQINLRLAARWHGLDITLDLFDLLDRRTVVDVDQVYASGAIAPIVGGTAADLVFLKDRFGGIATRRAAYGTPVAFAAPVSAVLGVHRSF